MNKDNWWGYFLFISGLIILTLSFIDAFTTNILYLICFFPGISMVFFGVMMK